MGTRQDWESLLEKVEKLVAYDHNGDWAKYINAVATILRKFIDTYDGNPDVDWWNRIFHSQRERIGSGGDYEEYLDGWILHFVGKYGRCTSESIRDYYIDVPVHIDNKMTGEIKTVRLVGGLGGLHTMSLDGRMAYRSQTSMIVVHDPSNKDDQTDAEAHFHPKTRCF